MADFEENLSKFATLAQSNPAPAPNPTDLAQIGAALSHPDAALALNMGRQRGNLVATENQVLQDSSTMEPYDFAQKYGPDVTKQVDTLNSGLTEYDRVNREDRNVLETAIDQKINPAVGFGSGVLNVGALAGGLIHEDIGRGISDFNESFRETAQGLQSEQTQRNRYLSGIRQQLDSADNDLQYERDRQTDGSFIATLNSIGRGALSGSSRLFEDTDAFEAGVGEGVGSLFVGGPTGKVVSLGAKLATGGAAAMSRAAATSVGIGLMEGGGAYTGAMQEILDTPHDQLLLDSPDYRALIAQGVEPDEARNSLAQSAGLVAAAIQAPIAIATGRLVARFEGSPLAMRGVRETVGNVGRETVEEGVQGLTGTLGQNLGVNSVDPTQRLSEGLGDALGEGAVLGGAVGGIVQVPSMAGQAGSAVIGNVLDRTRAVQTRLEEADKADISEQREIISDVTPDIVEAVEAAAPAVAATVTPILDENQEEDPEQETAVEIQERIKGLGTKIGRTEAITPEELNEFGVDFMESIEIQNDDAMPTTRFESIELARQLLEAPEADDDLKRASALFLRKQISLIREVAEQDIPAFLAHGADTESGPVIDAYHKRIKNLLGSEYLSNISKMTETLPGEAVGENGPTTQQINNTLIAAEVAPENINADVARALYQNTDEFSEVTPEQRMRLRAALDLHEVAQEHAQLSEEAGVPVSDAMASVTKNIETDEGDRPHKKSLTRHVSDVTNAMVAGNAQAASRHMRAMKSFAQVMANKVEALNKSIEANGERVKYQSFGANGKALQITDQFTMQVHPGQQGSMNFARQVHREAELVARTMQKLVDNFPQFRGEIPKIPALHSSLSLAPREAQPAPAKPVEKPAAPAPQKASLSPEVRKNLLDRIAGKIDKGRMLLSEFSEDEKAILKDRFGAKIGRKYATFTPRLAAYAAEQSPEEAAKNVKVKAPKRQSKGTLIPKRVQNAFGNLTAALGSAQPSQFKRITGDYQGQIRLDQPGTDLQVQKLADLVNENPSMGLNIQVNPEGSVDVKMTRDAFRAMKEGKLVLPGYVRSKPKKAEQQAAKQEAEPVVSEPTQEENQRKGTNSDSTPESVETTLEVLYPTLVTTDGPNLFKQAYSLDKKASSKLVGEKKPFDMVRKLALSSREAITEFRGKEGKAFLNDTNMPLLSDLFKDLGDVRNVLNYRFAHAKDYPDAKGEYKTIPALVSLKAGKGADQYQNGKVLSLLVPSASTPSGFQLEPALLDQSILAAGDWLMNNVQNSQNLTEEELIDQFGLSDDFFEINEDAGDLLNAGIALDFAKRTLASRLKEFWGVKDNAAVTQSDTQGIAESMAAEIILAMNQKGLLKVEYVRVSAEGNDVSTTDNEASENGNRTFVRILPTLNDNFIPLGSARHVIADIALTEDTMAGVSIGKPFTTGSNTLLRQSNVPTSKEQKEAEKNAGNTPYFTNEVAADFYMGMSQDTFISTFGGRMYDPDLINVNDARRVAGKNQTLATSFVRAKEFMAEVLDNAKGMSTAVKDLPIYFQHVFNKVGRHQMSGAVNVQNSKLWREMFQPFKEVLDLSGNNPEHEFFYWKAIAQGIGLKTEKVNGATTMAKAKARLMDSEGDLFPLVQELVVWLDARDAALAAGKEAPSVSDSFMQEVKRVMPNVSNHAMTSLMSIAQYTQAIQKDADLTKFESWVYMEADGINHGPAGAVRKYMSGPFSATWVDLAQMTGQFFQGPETTMNNYHEKGEGKDAYTLVSAATTKNITEFRDTLPADHRDQMDTLFRVMQAFGLGYRVEQDRVVIERSSAKNPVTITIYGSGMRGIVGKVARELTTEIYSYMSKISEQNLEFGADLIHTDGTPYGRNRLVQDLNKVINTEAIFIPAKDGAKARIKLVGVNDAPSADQLIRDPKTMTLRRAHVAALEGNVSSFLVRHMIDAIHSNITVHTQELTDLMQKASQVQSIFQKGMFAELYVEALAQRMTNPMPGRKNKPRDLLSKREQEDLMKRVTAFAPLYKGKRQTFDVSSNETTADFGTKTVNDGNKQVKVSLPRMVSTSVTEKLASAPRIYSPGLAGVKIVPSMTIGGTDGLMMQGFWSKPSALAFKASGVFDGLNLSPLSIAEASTRINESISEAWLDNPITGIKESFETFMAQDPVEVWAGMDPALPNKSAMQYEVSRVFFGKAPERLLEPEEMRAFLDTLEKGLVKADFDVNANMETVRRFSYWTDQMAGGEKPSFNQGQITLEAGLTPAQIADRMNEVRAEVIAEMRAKESNKPKVDPNRFKDALTLYAQQVGGVFVIPATRGHLVNTINGLKDTLPAEHADMMLTSLQALETAGYTLVMGPRSEIDAYTGTSPDMSKAEGDWKGKTDPTNKVIYIQDINSETLAHELIHAATIHKLDAFYTGNGKGLSAEERGAIQRISGLMYEFLNTNLVEVGGLGKMAYLNAQAAINRSLQLNDTAGAVSEFLSWSLSNSALASVQKKMSVKDSIFRLAGEVLQALKTLIWGDKASAKISDDLYSQLRFNMKVLSMAPAYSKELSEDLHRLPLYQSESFGTDERLVELRKSMMEKMAKAVATTNPLVNAKKEQEVSRALAVATDASNKTASEFPMTMQEKSTHQAIVAGLVTNHLLNPVSYTRMSQVYNEVVDQLSPEDFMMNPLADDPNDRAQALRKYNILMGVDVLKTDKLGRSSLVPNFIALAMTNDTLRSVLRGKKLPERVKSDGTVDEWLTEQGTRGMELIYEKASGQKGKNVQEILDSLAENLMANVGDQRSNIEIQADSSLDKLDGLLRDQVLKVQSLADTAGARLATSPVKAVETTGRGIQLMSKFLSEEGTKAAGEVMLRGLNMTNSITAREFISDVVGRTESNAPIFDMISKARTIVDQMRQRYRKEMPNELKAQFSRTLRKEEWAAMTDGFAKTDIGFLFNKYGVNETVGFLEDGRKLDAKRRSLESQITAEGSDRAVKILEKAKQLANYMNTGVAGTNLLTNANLIAMLAGERRLIRTEDAVSSLVPLVDELVSVYALQGISAENRGLLQDLLETDRKGVESVLSVLNAVRQDEMTKQANSMGRLNYYKGSIRILNQEGVHLLVAPLSQRRKLDMMGYKRVAEYVGDPADSSSADMAYYFAPVSGKAKYNQGTLQTVHQTFGGVDPVSGFTADHMTAGRISDRLMVARIAQNFNRSKSGTENLRAVYDVSGQPIGFERMVDPSQLARVNQNKNLAELLGAWRGRQQEEIMSEELNTQMVDRAYGVWKNAKGKPEAKEFVDVSKITRKEDPVLFDSWALVPEHTRRQILQTFGSDGFMVRKDMVNDVLGYRSASIGDSWTGSSRWSPEAQTRIRNAAMSIFGMQAYTNLLNAEQFLQDQVLEAKLMIVVKSVVVPVANLMSNMGQLASMGVPIRHMLVGMRNKTMEINEYVKLRNQEVKLETDLMMARGRQRQDEIMKIETRIKVLKDTYKRMSIWPLIDAGEFSAISDGVPSEEDMSLANGTWTNKVRGLMDKVPAGVKLPIRHLMITKDTPTFKALASATQYGDFIGKAIAYDYLVNTRKMDPVEAIANINEEFVNYNRHGGRTRQALEDNGLLWFYHFKIRSIKIGARMMHRNPARALLMGVAMPDIPGFGTPIGDNFVSKLFDGSMWYSMGPGMGLRAPQMNPWYATFIE